MKRLMPNLSHIIIKAKATFGAEIPAYNRNSLKQSICELNTRKISQDSFTLKEHYTLFSGFLTFHNKLKNKTHNKKREPHYATPVSPKLMNFF
jgi:hypothetical protein